jgi:hypothetical protein
MITLSLNLLLEIILIENENTKKNPNNDIIDLIFPNTLKSKSSIQKNEKN